MGVGEIDELLKRMHGELDIALNPEKLPTCREMELEATLLEVLHTWKAEKRGKVKNTRLFQTAMEVVNGR